MIWLLSFAAFASAFIGGLFTLRFKDKLHLILGFSAGTLIGVVLFDLFPESVGLSGDAAAVGLYTAIGFCVYLILDRFFVLHVDPSDNEHSHRGVLGAGSLFVHSFIDGVALGIALQISALTTIAVAIAILTHRFSDGVNTVSLILKSGGNQKTSLLWLLGVSLSPVLGILTSFFLFQFEESSLSVILPFIAGIFLYLGASELLPESHHHHKTVWTTIATLFGIVLIYAIVQIAHV